jgi:LemA protein
MKTLSKGAIALLVIALVAFGVISWYFSTKNSLVSVDESVSTAWSNVENQYQRRADLIPNLVETVKGYAKHEENTFKEVVEARAKATQITVDPTNMTPEKMKEFQAAQGELGSALGRLIAVSENYPELKANENFKYLQAQLEGTENRINETRRQFNQAVQDYNLKVRQFPSSIVANMAGFTTKTKFEAEAGSEKAPKVSFE